MNKKFLFYILIFMTLLDLNVWGKGQAEDHTAPAADAITEDISENAGMPDMTLPAYVPAEDVVQESAEPEDNAQKQSLQTEIAETSDETVDTAEMAEDQETEEVSMFRKTLLQDMDTANYYELVEWCRSLNLPENGDAAALKNSLMEYYKVQEEKKPDKKGDTIIIRSSDKTRYFSIEQMDQNYIIITGNVVLEVNEEDKDIKHQIQADKLIYNQNKQLMTADGNVIYTKTSEGKDEKFFGDKLTFNMENWSGVFFAGISEKTMTMNEKEVKFYYSGEKIHRISKEVSIMENADITSQQDADTSYYRLHAKKIWLLAPGEWGVSNAVLYVGNIPMFYFPFFFKPGDRFVMRPSVGYQEQKGHFIQTTTYLYGEPSAADSENLSFLAASDAEDRLYEKELNGLYLRRTDVKKANPDDSSFVKIMLDLYYNLGFYGAVQGDLKGNSYFNDTKFYLGIGKTRNVYNESGFFTPFYEYEDGSQEDHWHRGYLGNKRLPFRFGAELDTGFDYKIFRSTLAFDIYSDPYLLRDFENRSESMNWGKLLGMEDNTEDDVDDYTGVRDRLYWFFHTELNPDFGNVNKYLSFKLTKMDFYMNWVNKERDITGMKGLDPSLPGYIDPSYSTDFFFPESTFYYPENYVLPDMSFTVSGTIFDTVYNKDTNYQRQEKKKEKALAKAEKQMLRKEDEGETDASAEEADAETGEDEPAAPHSVSDSIAALDSDSDRLKSIMKKPFADDKKDDGDKKRETKVLRVPDAAEDEPITLYSDHNFFSHNLGYSITPNFIIDNRMDTVDVVKPSDVSMDKAYAIMRTYGDGKVQYQAYVMDRLLSLDENIIFKGEYRKHTDRADSITDDEWLSMRQEDYNATTYNIDNDMIFKTQPFYMFDRISESYLSYRMNTKLFNRMFDRMDSDNDPIYENQFFEWDKDCFNNHEAELLLSYLPFWNQHQTIRFKTVFEPMNKEFENENIFTTGIVTSSTFFRVTEDDDHDYEFEPFRWTERVDYGKSYLQGIYRYDLQHNQHYNFEGEGKISFFDDDVYFKQSYIYDMREGHHEEAISTLNIWFFNLMYKAEWMYPYYYEDGIGWLQREDEKFVPSKLTATINYSKYGKPFWRNRIRYKTNIQAGYNMDLQKFTDNSFIFSMGFEANVYRLFNVSFSTTSENNSTYRYSDRMSGKIGQEKLNPLEDLWNSLKLWDKSSRYESSFKLKSLDAKIVHHLGDWDLSYTYSGVPDLETNSSGIPEWKWKSEFCILVQWNPIPELKTQVKYKDDKYNM